MRRGILTLVWDSGSTAVPRLATPLIRPSTYLTLIRRKKRATADPADSEMDRQQLGNLIVALAKQLRQPVKVPN